MPTPTNSDLDTHYVNIPTPVTTAPPSRRSAPDPYDPDPDCKMTWHSILLVNSTAWFQPPSNALDSYFELAETNTNTAQDITGSPYSKEVQLIKVVQSFVNGE